MECHFLFLVWEDDSVLDNLHVNKDERIGSSMPDTIGQYIDVQLLDSSWVWNYVLVAWLGLDFYLDLLQIKLLFEDKVDLLE